MKRICLLLIILLLCGCAADPNMTTQPPAEPVLTIEPWDADGTLCELVLEIPGGNTYTECLGFRDGILLWTTDGHRQGQQELDLCLVDPGTNSIAAARKVTMPNPVTPQVYGDSMYLSDPVTGTVLELDRKLRIVGEWSVPASDSPGAVWYAANRKLWEFAEGKPLRCLSLGEIYWSEDQTAEWAQVRLPREDVYRHRLSGGIVSFSCLSGEREQFYALDLTEGTVITPPQGYDQYYRSGNVWLGSRYDSGYHYGIFVGAGAMRKISPIDGTLSLLPEGYLLEKSPADQYLRLYDREGRCISTCRLWENQDGYAQTLIWNNAMGGYLIHYRPQSGGSRLLFWDIQKGTVGGQNLKLRSIPAEDAVQDALRAEAAALADRFGITIAVGTDCDLEQANGYNGGNTTYARDFDLVCNALDTLERALGQYPDDFFRQMQEEFIPRIRFEIVADFRGEDPNCEWISSVSDDRGLLIFDIAYLDEDAVKNAVAHVENMYREWSEFVPMG